MDRGPHRVCRDHCAFFSRPFLWLLRRRSTARPRPTSAGRRIRRFDNFSTIFQELDFGRVAGEQLFIVATATMILAVDHRLARRLLAVAAEIRRKGVITYGVLVLQTMPLSATMVPIYGLARDLHLRNSYLGLILIHSAIEIAVPDLVDEGLFRLDPALSRRGGLARRPLEVPGLVRDRAADGPTGPRRGGRVRLPQRLVGGADGDHPGR